MNQKTPSSTTLSVILPAYNEAESLRSLIEEVFQALEPLKALVELIIVDDGSSDETWQVILEKKNKYPQIEGIQFARNYGQSMALQAGFELSQHEYIIVMDADGQNDPHDIALLLSKISDGFDMVSGWRKDRKDKFMSRRLPSVIANKLISKVTGVNLSDYGCSMKCYRAKFLKELVIYGELHRFIPVFMVERGARFCEVEVNHRPRTTGSSSYGLERVPKVFFDLILTTYFLKFKGKAGHFFGYFALGLFLLSFIAISSAVIMRLFLGITFVETPLLVLSGFGFISSLLSVAVAIQLDMTYRVLNNSSKGSTYHIRERA